MLRGILEVVFGMDFDNYIYIYILAVLGEPGRDCKTCPLHWIQLHAAVKPQNNRVLIPSLGFAMWQLAISSCIDPKGRRPCSAVSGLAAVKFVITDQQSVKSKHPHHSTCALCFKKFSLALEPHVFRLPHPYLNKRRLQGPSGLTETVQYQKCCKVVEICGLVELTFAAH